MDRLRPAHSFWALRRGAGVGSPRRPCGGGHPGPRRPIGHRPRGDRGRHPGLRQPGGRGQPQRRPNGRVDGRPARGGRRADGQSTVRQRAPGRQFGRPRDRRRRRRRLHRRRRRVDDTRAPRDAQAGGRVRAWISRDGRHDPGLALCQSGPGGDASSVLDGRDRRERGRAAGRQPRGTGRLRADQPAQRGRRDRRGAVRRPDRAGLHFTEEGRTDRRGSRRASPPRHDSRSAGPPAAGIPRRRHRHGGQFQRHQRRGVGGAGRGGGPRSWASAQSRPPAKPSTGPA